MTAIAKLQRLSLALLALVLVSGCLPYSTGPTEVGVRTVKWSLTGQRGVEERVYEPGRTFFFVPFLTDWHTFDTRTQNMEMTETVGRGDRMGRDELLFKTIDGNDIGLDVIFTYRIDPKKAPQILQEVATSNEALRDSIVRTVCRSKPRDIFGELNTEEFYTAESRSAKANEVEVALNKILEPYGVIVERVGTRDYRFNPEYQQAIEDKKVADQEAERLKAETRAREEEVGVKVEMARADIEKTFAKADGEYKRALIEADAYFEQQKQIALAIEAEGEAEASGIRAMNQGLAGAGGEAMVKMAVAEALLDKRIVMLPVGGGGLDVRSTDINSLLNLYGIQKITEPKPVRQTPGQSPAPPPALQRSPDTETQ